ncbi:MAG TPA: SDR family NAD(P)-dependent oxidoreductase, partial [Thermoanaerobaculia bacterium]
EAAASGPAWTLHAGGRVSLAPAAGGADPPGAGGHDAAGAGGQSCLPEEIQARCPAVLAKPEIYRAAARRGLAYGPAFQRLERLWRGDGEALGLLSELPGGSAYRIDPGLLDGCLQVVLGALPEALGERLLLPVQVASLRVAAGAGEPRWCHVRLRDGGAAAGGVLRADLSVADAQGRTAIELLGLELRGVERPARAAAGELADWLFGLEWEAQDLPAAAAEGQAPEVPVPAVTRRVENARLSAAAAMEEPEAAPSPAAAAASPTGCWLILADAGGAGGRLAARLAERGERVLVAFAASRFAALGDDRFRLAPERPQGFRRLARELAREGISLRGIVHLWSLDAAPVGAEPADLQLAGTEPADARLAGTELAAGLAGLQRAQELGPLAALHAVRELAETADTPPRLWLVTRGAQAVGPDDPLASPAQAPLWGFARSLAHERPGLSCTLVDLDPAAPAPEIEQLGAELRSGGGEPQVAFRGGRRLVARLARTAAAALAPSVAAAGPGTRGGEGEPFRLDSASPGLLDRLAFRPLARRSPAPGEVEIEVVAAGLNFRDVMLALGIYPGGGELGLECAGRVARVGEQVKELAPGDEVIAFAPPCFGSFAHTPAAVVAGKPRGLSFAAAATIPAAFVTAEYALRHLGRLQRGERVLIHQATGGVGQAAIQVARRAGAAVLVTAGSPEKRELLRSWGIEHVMDSRSLAFAGEVLAATGGTGVDLVLSALRGEAIAAGLAALAPFGRFLDISKSGPGRAGRLDRGALAKSLAYFVIDVDALLAQRPELIGELLREVVAGFADGSLAPLPWRGFPAAEAAAAFRLMAQARHTGKLVLAIAERAGVVVRRAAAASPVRSDGTYLVSGGLGGLGIAVARWLAEQGAGGLLLLGRGAPPPAAAAAIEEMRGGGTRVVVASADVAAPEQLAAALAAAGVLPPLRGVVHAAGVLADALVSKLDRAAMEQVAAPKVLGAWNLHVATLAAPLDFFVLFSSAASLLGSPGQAGYAAANAFLDALAHYRRRRGLPALAINWGPWAEIGLAARPDRGGRLAARGLASLSPRDGVAAFGRLLGAGIAQVGVMPFDVERWRELYPGSAASPTLSRLAAPAGRGAGGDGRLSRGKLLSAAAPERESLLVAYLGTQTARVVGLSASGLLRLDPGQPLQRLGLDSLMAVELKNRIEADLGVGLPLRSFLQGANLRQVCGQVLEQLPAAAAAGDGRWEEGEV